jgi:muramoyltetrapeptide carboxypeptidase
MGLSRRKFIGFAAGTAAFGAGALRQNASDYHDLQDKAFADKLPTVPLLNEKKIILPKALAKGSKIAITAPASGTSMGEVNRGAKYFRNMGCEVVIGKTIAERTWEFQYLSAPDKTRAAELMEYITDPTVNCILCARGGYGVLRILPYLDFRVIGEYPKIYIGFSDITALINSIYARTGIVAFHGPVASSSFNEFSGKALQKILFVDGEFIPVKISNPKAKTVVPGKATGRLVGGNLSLVTSLLGSPFDVDTTGCILLLEETFTEPYIIDRMITQLWIAGKLQVCSGIAIGNFEGLDAKRNFYPGRSYTIREVLEMRLRQLKLPSVMGLPFGHVKDNVTLPIGAMAELDADKKTLTILEKPVS